MAVVKDFNFISQRDVVEAPTVARTSIAYAADNEKGLTQYAPNVVRSRFTDGGDFSGYLIEADPYVSAITESEDFSDGDIWHGKTYRYQNYILQSEDLDESGDWSQIRILSVADSGTAAPDVLDVSFGNYWKVTPNTSSGGHSIDQVFDPVVTTGQATFFVKSGGYTELRFYLTIADGSVWIEFTIDAETGVISGDTGFDSVVATDKGSGDWLVTAKWLNVEASKRIYLQILDNGVVAYPGNGTDGILITRVQVSELEKDYIKTTTTALDYDEEIDFTIDGAALGPDNGVSSASRITMPTGAGMEFYEEPSQDIGDTTFTMDTGGVTAMVSIEMIPENEGGEIPNVIDAELVGERSGSGSIILTWADYTYDTNDVAILFTESDGNSTSFSGTGVTTIDSIGVTTVTRLGLAWIRLDGTEGLTATGTVNLADHATLSVVFIRGCKTTGNPFGQYISSTDITADTDKTLTGYDGDRRKSLALCIATYDNDLASNPITAVTNANLTDITVHIDGEGTTLGDGGGVSAFSGGFDAGVDLHLLSGPSGVQAYSSVFLRKESGSDIVQLYNNRNRMEFVDIDLSDTENPPIGVTIQEYANSYYRISLFIDEPSSSYEYGFGLGFSGVYDVFGANLTAGSEYMQYMIDETEFSGETITEQSGVNMVYSSIPEPDPDYDVNDNDVAAVIWVGGIYDKGDWVIEDHLIYQVIADPSTSKQPSVSVNEATPEWAVVRPSNLWSIFNKQWQYGTIAYYNDEVKTYALDGALEYAFNSSFLIDSIGAHNVDAQRIVIRSFVEGVLQDEVIVDLTSFNGIDDYYDWFNKEPVRIREVYINSVPWQPNAVLSVRFENDSGGEVSVGKMTLGTTVEVGTTLSGVQIDGRDFSRTSRNEYGNAGISQGREIDLKRYQVLIEDSSRVAYLNETIKDQGVKPTTWVGNINYESTIALGIRSRRGFTIGTNMTTAELTIEEL